MNKRYIIGMCSALALSFVTHVCNAADKTKAEEASKSVNSPGWLSFLTFGILGSTPTSAQIEKVLTDALDSGDPERLADAVDHVSALRFKLEEDGATDKVAELDAAIKANTGLVETCLTQDAENKTKAADEDDAMPKLLTPTAPMRHRSPLFGPQTLAALTMQATAEHDEATRLAAELATLKQKLAEQASVIEILKKRGEQVVEEAKDDAHEGSNLRGLFDDLTVSPQPVGYQPSLRRPITAQTIARQRRSGKRNKN